MEQVQKIEGISPDMLWTFIIVLVGLAAIFVLGYKVVEILRKEHERKVQREQLNGTDITDRIADKVIEKLQPTLDEKFGEVNAKFDEIDRKLQNDKEVIELHTTQLNAQKSRTDRLDNDNKALLHGMSALLSHEINGNSVDKLTKTQEALHNYLIDGIYKEDDWK